MKSSCAGARRRGRSDTTSVLLSHCPVSWRRLAGLASVPIRSMTLPSLADQISPVSSTQLERYPEVLPEVVLPAERVRRARSEPPLRPRAGARGSPSTTFEQPRLTHLDHVQRTEPRRALALPHQLPYEPSAYTALAALSQGSPHRIRLRTFAAPGPYPRLQR